MPSASTTAEQHFLHFAIQWSSINIFGNGHVALLYYDYALTLPSEIRYIWQERFKVSTGLYILFRYALLANVLYLLAISNKIGNKRSLNLYHGSHCDTVYKVIAVISVLGRTAVIFTFLMRTYAVWHKSTSILICLGLGGGLISLRKHTLEYLIIKQGVLHFGLVSVFTVGATVLNFRALGGFPQRLPNALTLPLSGILSARFILRIRAFSKNTDPFGSGSSHGDVSIRETSSGHFAIILNN